MSGSETALFSLSKSEIEGFKNSSDSSERSIARLLARPERLLATILIANNFVNIGIVLIFEYLLRHYMVIDNDIIRVLVSVVLTTFLLLLLGEVLPKVYATGNNRTEKRRVGKARRCRWSAYHERKNVREKYYGQRCAGKKCGEI